ncbi:MAG: DUF971 domain-containing protein [Caulobacterales bacterium]|nr:DUF971 domain-containing protein [Caulobacterales bacterium]
MTAPEAPAGAWPVELRFERGPARLVMIRDDGSEAVIPFELLRVESPSAEVQGHGPSGKKLVPGKRGVGVAGAEPVGNYAVRILFDDGHDTGLFTWDYLAALAADSQARLEAYERRLTEAGLSRDPRPPTHP